MGATFPENINMRERKLIDAGMRSRIEFEGKKNSGIEFEEK